MRKFVLLAAFFLLQSICAKYSSAQELFFESTLYSDSIVVDDWVSNKYGVHVQKYEPQRLQVKNSTTNNTTSWQHLSYGLTYKNIPLEFCQIKVHKKDGVIVSINGALYDEINVNTIPTISENSARNTAVSYIGADVYSWQLSSLEYFDLIDAPQLRDLPQGTLVICPISMNNSIVDSVTLAYKFSIYAIAPESYQDVYVDAHTNNVLFTLSKMSSVTGIADTWYSGIQNIETSYKDGKYYLHDSTRCDGTVCIYTYDMSGTTNYESSLVREITDNDNHWTTAEFRLGRRDMAFDAHWGAGVSLDYFYETFGRIGYDGYKPIRNYVHWIKATHASWNGHVLRFGDGSDIYNPLVSLDIVAHEIGHAVTTSEADLIYSNESGAINEGISDIWAACVCNFVEIEKDLWLIAEECCLTDSAFRSMCNPKMYYQPDTYKGIHWHDYEEQTDDNGGVHKNSGIMNYWFFLLTMGGQGTNDNGYFYDIEGIGFEKSEQIVYKSLVDYFTETTDYNAAAILTREAAIELFGFCSEEVQTVIEAWKAVGITIDIEIPQSLHISETISTDSILIYRAIDSIIATNTILEGSNVTYITSENIYLRDGFNVKEGAIFRAIVEPCSHDYNISQRVTNKKNTISQNPTNSLTQTECKVDVYPNPCNDVLTISNIPNNILTYQVFDIHGKLMKIGYINQTEITLETTNLPSGVYVLSLCAKHQFSYFKFIKQ